MTFVKDNKLPNLKILRPMRIRGVAYGVGDVVAKTDFSGTDGDGDWMDLAAMSEPWLEQTKEPVARAGKGKAAKPTLPVAG